MNEQPIYSVTDFVAICNQVLDVSFGSMQIQGEVSQFKISKGKWVYFDLRDDYSSVRFFGNVYQLPAPLEDGMKIVVRGTPRLHEKYGFSITIQSIQLKGEGTIKKASQLLELKLEKEGLFAPERKRPLPYPPTRVGLITSSESAAYADFVKILNSRWGGIEIELCDVQVQGEKAVGQIQAAINHLNAVATLVDVIVITRGGGGLEDLQAFSAEGVTRAVAGSRIPTLVAIGHEIDISLAERAADMRASTPSNAAERLTPDKRHEAIRLRDIASRLEELANRKIIDLEQHIKRQVDEIGRHVTYMSDRSRELLTGRIEQLNLLDPQGVIRRGYAIVRQEKKVVSSVKSIDVSLPLEIELKDGKQKVGVLE